MDVGTLVDPALTAIQAGLTDVAGPALLLGAGVVALRIGWRFAKGLVKG